jgi:hypothetical protein
MSASDILAITSSQNRDGAFGGNGAWIILLFIFILAIGGGNFGWGNGNSSNALGVAELQNQIQTGFSFNDIGDKLDGITNGLCTVGYNALQNSNNITQAMNQGFDAVNMNINNLSHEVAQGFCSIKTQLLQDKYDTVSRELVQAQNTISNNAQSQYILGQLGSYYTNPPCYGNYYNTGCGCNNLI